MLFTALVFSILSLQPAATPAPQVDWRTAESSLLADHVQLTSRERFLKAGEAYFDHQSPPGWVIFQAIAAPKAGDVTPAQPYYSMYIAHLKYDAKDPAKIAGIEEPIEVSGAGSANTCGWFVPPAADAPSHASTSILFASTLSPPSETAQPGYQRGTGKYRWEFPREMRIVRRGVLELEPPKKPGEMFCGNDYLAQTVVGAGDGYVAEGSLSSDGRFLVFSKMMDPTTKNLDICIRDVRTGEDHAIITAPGYDGGPFFSPDAKRLCFRSDRAGNDLLQVYVADLKFEDGVPVGIERESPLTANEHVNWGPYWHPSGTMLVYATSEMGHTNYEIFAIEVPARGEAKVPDQVRRRRVTNAAGADVLPVFSDDGKYMMWTTQRGPQVEGESRPSSQVWAASVSQGQFKNINEFFGSASAPAKPAEH